MLEGLHAIKHALRFDARLETCCIRDDTDEAALSERLGPDIVRTLRAIGVRVAADVFDALSPDPPRTGIVALARRPSVDPERLCACDRTAPVVVLDRPADAGNVGAVVRVAAAAGASAVLCTGPHDPWHARALRGSAGAHFALPVARVERIPPARPLIALDPTGRALSDVEIPDDAVLLFGSERDGLSATARDAADMRLSIPMRAGLSSLNLATSVAITLYRWRLGRPRSGDDRA